MRKLILLAITLIAFISCNNKRSTQEDNIIKSDNISLNSDNSLYLLVGTYTSTDSKGIYVYQFDTITGDSKYVSEIDVINPSYITVSKDEKHVYAVTENEDETSTANAFSFNKEDGKLSFINSLPTGGGAPCFINTDESNSLLITANYLGGSITSFKINKDGALESGSQKLIKFMGQGGNPDRQSQPHLHCVQFTPDNKYVLANDLGTDRIHKLTIDNDAETENKVLSIGTPAFFETGSTSGPRHLEFHPNGKYAYLITELSGEVIAYSYQDGSLNELQRVQADTLNAMGSGDIHITPNGKFLYASNRLKGDGLAIFAIDQLNGKLTKVGYQDTGIHPRNFVITPNGKQLLVACRDSNTIQVYSIDQETGHLENMFKDIELDMPVCLKFISMK